jgi:TonB family protein
VTSHAQQIELAPAGTRLRQGAGFAAALLLHAGIVAIALRCEPGQAAAALIVTEVDLAPAPEPEPEKPAPEPEPEKPAAEPARVHHRAPAAPRETPPAAAGALHTAQEDAQPSASEPVRFAVDANGAGYGFGVVAQGGSGTGRGGNAESAAPTASASAPVARAPALRAFAVPPRLDESDPCRGFFPNQASADRGEVTVKLLISDTGQVQRASVLSEEPANQGFGRAAQTCLKAKRFIPARDQGDRATAAEAPVTVRFSR